eukprot:4866091-Alexandrium_andersonii.AAC.1
MAFAGARQCWYGNKPSDGQTCPRAARSASVLCPQSPAVEGSLLCVHVGYATACLRAVCAPGPPHVPR